MKEVLDKNILPIPDISPLQTSAAEMDPFNVAALEVEKFPGYDALDTDDDKVKTLPESPPSNAT